MVIIVRWNDVVEFLEKVETKNGMGDVVISLELTTMAYANKKSVRQSEFYQAGANGLKPEKMFEVRTGEYNDEDYLRHSGKTYYIIRTFEKGDITEIVCEGWVNNADS